MHPYLFFEIFLVPSFQKDRPARFNLRSKKIILLIEIASTKISRFASVPFVFHRSSLNSLLFGPTHVEFHFISKSIGSPVSMRPTIRLIQKYFRKFIVLITPSAQHRAPTNSRIPVWLAMAQKKSPRTAICEAAKSGDESELRRLLLKSSDQVETTCYFGRTPLSWAARGGHILAATLLLSYKQVNANSSDTFGCTPLSLAAAHGHWEMVALLLKQEDVDPNHKEMFGCTPLTLAAINGRQNVVVCLLENEDVVRYWSLQGWMENELKYTWAWAQGYRLSKEQLFDWDCFFSRMPQARGLMNDHHDLVRRLRRFWQVNVLGAERLPGSITTTEMAQSLSQPPPRSEEQQQQNFPLGVSCLDLRGIRSRSSYIPKVCVPIVNERGEKGLRPIPPVTLKSMLILAQDEYLGGGVRHESLYIKYGSFTPII